MHGVLHNLTAVKEADDAIGQFGLFFIVGHHHDCASVVLVERVEKVHDLSSHFGIKVTGRFVGKDDFGISDNSTGDGHALALSAGELRGHVAHAVAETYAVKYLADATGTF